MFTLSMLHIAARDRDFQLFEENDSLGENIKPAFKAFVYGCGRDAFNEAWIRGMKWGWAQANIELNERASARMKHAFDFVYGPEHSPSNHQIINGVPRYDTLDDTWYRSVIAHISLAHLKMFAPLHQLQQKPNEEKFANIVRFYHGVLALSWRAGWDDGERYATVQHDQRDQDQGIFATIDSTASQMEHETLEQRAETMFKVTNEDIDAFERKLDSRIARVRESF